MKRNLRIELNRFDITDILMEISKLSAEILISPRDTTLSINNARYLSYSIGKYKKTQFIVSSWILLDMAYYVIKNVSDSYTKYPFDEEKFIELIHLYISYEYQKEIPSKKDELLIYLYGFLGEQTTFQSYHKVEHNYCRERYIIDRMFDKNELDIIVDEEIGVNSEKLPILLFYLFLISISNIDVLSHSVKLHGVSADDINKVINYYSEKIEKIRESPYKRQHLYSKPFIEGISINPFPVNVYLIYHIFQNCIFWTVRNYYYKRKSEKFTRDFGYAFEGYVDELLSEYMDDSAYEKIAESDNPRADYRVELGDYNILIEVKSSLAGLLSKQQESDIKTTTKFIDRILLDAVNQLKNTEEYYSDKKYIKLIVVYENYFKSEMLEVALNRAENIIDDGSYWLVTIEELEKLLYLYKEDINLFSEIMNLKVEYEFEHSVNGRDFNQIFTRFDIDENHHLKQERFSQYMRRINDYISKNQYVEKAINDKDSRI